MHMNSAPHLLAEDRPEYERILGDALRHAHERPDLAGVGERLNTEQLRTMALNATALITAAAATEYDHYVKVREELRGPAADSAQGSGLGSEADDPDRPGAGIGAVVTVLAPMLAGTAALIFLLVGYILKMLSRPPSFADTMVTAGWFFAAVMAAAILAAAIGLLTTALRNGSTSLPAEDTEDELPEDVARARRPGVMRCWSGASCRSCGMRSPIPRPAPHHVHRTVRPTASRRSATPGRTSRVRKRARRRVPARRSPAPTSPARTSAARNTSWTDRGRISCPAN